MSRFHSVSIVEGYNFANFKGDVSEHSGERRSFKNHMSVPGVSCELKQTRLPVGFMDS